jgi:hypothetical protein
MGKKAINRNGVIKVYEGVPKTLYSSTGTYLNAPAMTSGELRSAGLFDVVLPDGYDSQIHDLSEIYWDSANIQFTYDKSNKTWSQTVAELKEQKIANLKSSANSKLSKTDWYIVREAEGGTATPQDILDERAGIRTTVATKESEINAKTTKASVITYDISL